MASLAFTAEIAWQTPWKLGWYWGLKQLPHPLARQFHHNRSFWVMHDIATVSLANALPRMREASSFFKFL